MQYLNYSFMEYFNLENGMDFTKEYILFIVCCILAVLFMFLLQIIAHEFGHYIFGMLSGFRFASFRIFSITFVKEGGRLRIRKYSLPGTLGQCLMSPPESSISGTDYRLYTLGGIILNTALAAVSLLFALGPLPITLLGRMFLLTGSFYGLGFALANGIPNRRGRIINDGTLVYLIGKDKQAAKSYNIQMSMIQGMLEGKTYKEYPAKIIKVPEGAELSNPLIGWHKIYECYYYMETWQLNDAYGCILSLEPFMSMATGTLKNTILMEKLFISILLGMDRTELDNIYGKIKRTLNNRKADLNTIRVRWAYELYKDSSEINKERIRKELDIITKKYPYKGEVNFCAGMVNELLARYKGDHRKDYLDTNPVK